MTTGAQPEIEPRNGHTTVFLITTADMVPTRPTTKHQGFRSQARPSATAVSARQKTSAFSGGSMALAGRGRQLVLRMRTSMLRSR